MYQGGVVRQMRLQPLRNGDFLLILQVEGLAIDNLAGGAGKQHQVQPQVGESRIYQVIPDVLVVGILDEGVGVVPQHPIAGRSVQRSEVIRQDTQGTLNIAAGSLFFQIGETTQQDDVRDNMQKPDQADERQAYDEQCFFRSVTILSQRSLECTPQTQTKAPISSGANQPES